MSARVQVQSKLCHRPRLPADQLLQGGSSKKDRPLVTGTPFAVLCPYMVSKFCASRFVLEGLLDRSGTPLSAKEGNPQWCLNLYYCYQVS